MTRIVQGYIDPESGRPCGWANGSFDCSVPDCKYSVERCILVQRERGLAPSSARTSLLAGARAAFDAWCQDASEGNAQEFMVVYADALLAALGESHSHDSSEASS